ncbi:MAG: usg protein [Methylocystis sp.]
MASRDFRRMVEGYGLTTANILYRLPDYPAIVQSYVWQEYDLHPYFPELHKFLDFWTRSLEGKLHSVLVAHATLIRPTEISIVDAEFKLH